MWLLTTDNPSFGGKRVWLPPGKKHIIGRTKQDEGGFVIDDKTVSRKHMVIEVHPVRLDDCAKSRTRSKITLEDLKTKIGSTANGKEIQGQIYELDRAENTFTVGRHKYHFTINWIPVNLTCTYTAKEEKAGVYAPLRETFAPFDVKILNHYETGVTTHILVKKRNTAKGLQALVDGKHIVHTENFLAAVKAAATPHSQSGKSLLEEDWDSNFPDPAKYLPEQGEKPTSSDASAYAPDTNRQNMFEGYTFIFYDSKQFNSLLPSLTQGGAKVLLREVTPSETQVIDFVRYVKEVAGEKGMGALEDGRGVVVVRCNVTMGPGSAWFADFQREVALHLDHRLIEQNEFLDAILAVDASVLRKPLEFAASSMIGPPSTARDDVISHKIQSSQPAFTPASTDMAPPITSRAKSRRAPLITFKAFDDSDDEDEEQSMAVDSVTTQQAISAMDTEPNSQSLFVTQDPEMDVIRNPPPRSSRKRNTPPIDYDMEGADEDAMLESLAPNAARQKKRRMEEDAAQRERGTSVPVPTSTQPAAASTINAKRVPQKSVPASEESAKPKKKSKVDLLEEMQKRKERAEELAREDHLITQQMDGMSFDEASKLAKVELMEIKRSSASVRAYRADESDRWDDQWNGRKNFKKFRRRGGEEARAREFHRVIVPLEVVQKKDYGIGDIHWGDDDSGKKKKARDSQSQNRSQAKAAQKEAEQFSREAEEHRAAQAELNALAEVKEAPSSDVEVYVQPKRLADKTTAAQNLPTSKKRPAATTLTKPAPVKKAKSKPVVEVEDSDEDSDDDLKFKFKKRR